MNKDDYIVSEFGEFNCDDFEKLLKLIKLELGKLELDQQITKRIYAASVECIDNIMKHSDDTKDDILSKKYPSRFKIQDVDDKIILYSANVIRNDNVDELIEKFEILSKMKHHKINQLYRVTLQKAEISDKGGAGLGLIIIARILGKKIKYDFERINDKFSYFALQIEFNKIL